MTGSDPSREGVEDRSIGQRILGLLVEIQAHKHKSFREAIGDMLRAGRTQSVTAGLAINGGTIAVGALGYWLFSGWLALAAVVFAILGALGILQWVIGW